MNLNESTEATLTTLTTQINAFVRDGTIDSRCAAELIKRLKREADLISECGKLSKPERKKLNIAFVEIEAALRNHDAGLLVIANAALRAGRESRKVREVRGYTVGEPPDCLAEEPFSGRPRLIWLDWRYVCCFRVSCLLLARSRSILSAAYFHTLETGTTC